MSPVFGKYRGFVNAAFDPNLQGRLSVKVPAVLGEQIVWAMPCVPYAGPNEGLVLTPSAGAQVWVEFEGGDINYPIWSGCFWKVGECPLPLPGTTATKVLKVRGITLTLDEMVGSGGLTLEVGPPITSVPITLTMGTEGVELSCDPAAFKLSVNGIEMGCQPNLVSVTPSDVKLEVPGGGVTAATSQVGMQCAGASVNLASANASVTINNGALEVI